MRILIVLAGLLLLIGGGILMFSFIQNQLGGRDTVVDQQQFPPPQHDAQQHAAEEDEEDIPEDDEPETVIGSSVQGRAITAYHYGAGETEILFVGGMHGGYSWNTAALAYEFMDYLERNPDSIPGNVQVTVIPVLNPDGLYEVVGAAGRFVQANAPTSHASRIAGRFNANNVDLNRNFDCDWQPTSLWQSMTVDAGSAPFSEPESQAFRSYAENRNPAAVVFWYGAAGGVFASHCGSGILPETRAIRNAYANASGYPAYDSFDFYDITGDAANWLARNNVPAFSVVLSTHEDTEWEQNRVGIEALLEYYAQ